MDGDDNALPTGDDRGTSAHDSVVPTVDSKRVTHRSFRSWSTGTCFIPRLTLASSRLSEMRIVTWFRVHSGRVTGGGFKGRFEGSDSPVIQELVDGHLLHPQNDARVLEAIRDDGARQAVLAIGVDPTVRRLHEHLIPCARESHWVS
jgi:hypothetical protein